jgi:hypothetical protein
MNLCSSEKNNLILRSPKKNNLNLGHNTMARSRGFVHVHELKEVYMGFSLGAIKGKGYPWPRSTTRSPKWTGT